MKFCKRAAAEGAKVVVADIAQTPEAKELVDGSDNLVYQECDVSKWSDLQRLVTVAKEKFGSTPDVYVAGAGVFEPKWSNFWHGMNLIGGLNVDLKLIGFPMKILKRRTMHKCTSTLVIRLSKFKDISITVNYGD